MVSDHVSKVATGYMQKSIEETYEKQVGPLQFGSVRRRGTALASLMLRSILEAAKLRGLAVAVVYLDLIKAFDTAIREVVAGWLPHQVGYSCEESRGCL